MKILKDNQLTILVIALMFVAAGYLSYTTRQDTNKVSTTPEEKLAAIGDAALVNSGEFIENEDKEAMLNSINSNMVNDKQENSINTVQTSSSTEDNYFAKSRLERETMYSQMLETYQKLLESSSIAQDQKAISQEQINKINQTKNGIMIAENLIKTKGFADVIIFVNDI